MDMDEIYVNTELIKSVQPTPSAVNSAAMRSKRRFHGAVVLSLVLLGVFLLAALVGLGVHYHDSAQHWAVVTVNLTERLQNAEKTSVSLSEERDLLTDELINQTKELQKLRSQCRHMTPCPTGWMMHESSCYFLSSSSGSWVQGRSDCRGRGADLVIVSSTEEQKFITIISKHETWIELSDRDSENTWKWTDGSPLTLTFWSANQPDNGNGPIKVGEEDCGVLYPNRDLDKNWNDLGCESSLHWICEKKALALSGN